MFDGHDVAVKTDDNHTNLRGLHNYALARLFTAFETSSTAEQGVVLLRSPSTINSCSSAHILLATKNT